MTHPRKLTRTAAIGTVATLALAACSGAGPTNESPTNQLEVISWWTSTSEKAALTVLYDAFKAAYPSVTLIDGAVAGGSGSNAQVVLASRLAKGDPPDLWQAFPGAALRQLVTNNRVLDVSSVYQESGLAAQMPKAVLDAVTVDGKQYAVPTSAHRQNVLWFNKAALTKASVNAPGRGYSLDSFVTDLRQVKKAGIPPLCLGGKDAFTKVELFENVLLGVIGPDGYTRIAADRFDWNSAPVRTALTTFGQLLDAADPEAGGLTWDAAAKKLAAGECAFLSMNDSAAGEILKAGAGTSTVGQVGFPGTEQAYLSVIDTFVLANGAKNAVNGRHFLAVVASAATQSAFSTQKGSEPIRADASISGLSAGQQEAAQVLRTGTVLMSIAHGQLLSPTFQGGFYDGVSAYATGRDVNSFNRALSRAALSGQPAGH